MDFIECPLLSQAFPSLPYNRDTEKSISNKKPRRILKAQRLIKKSSPIAKDSEGSIASKGGTKGPNASKTDREPSHVPNVAFRAIQQTLRNTRYRKASIRQSDILFLESEILCGVGTNTEVPKKKVLQSPQHTISGILKLNASKERTLQKRKILNSTDNLPKKRRTLDGDKEPSLAPFKTLERNNTKPLFKPKAVPNFTRIFEVRSEKTENIVEYKQRKAERAANLLSGAKSTVNAPKSTPTCVATPKMKRELTFTTENSPNIAKLPILQKQHMKATGYANQLGKSNRVLKVPQITSKKVNFNENYITKRIASKRTPLTCSTPYIGTIAPSNIPTNTQSTSSGHIIKKEIINKFGFRQDNKPNCLNLAQIQAIPKRSPILKASVESCGKAETLFAIKPNRVKKDEMVKAVQTKLRPDREMAASRRHEIKGVRLNRRFELLMQMRSQTMP